MRYDGSPLTKAAADWIVERAFRRTASFSGAPVLDYQISRKRHRSERLTGRQAGPGNINAPYHVTAKASFAVTSVMYERDPERSSILEWSRRDLGGMVDLAKALQPVVTAYPP